MNEIADREKLYSVSRIQSALDHHLPEQKDLHLDVLDITYSGSNSIIYRARSKQKGKTFAVKLCIDPRTSRKSESIARIQFDALQATHGLLRDDRYRIPRPISCIDKEALVVIEWVAGPSLLHLLRHPLTRNSTLNDSIRHGGHLLRNLHDVHQRGSSSLKTGLILDQLREITQSHDAYVENEKLFESCIGRLSETADRIGRIETARSVLHGDFKSSNIILCNGAYYAFDLGMTYDESVIHDIGQFLNDLEIDLLVFRRWRMCASIDSVSRQFLDAYSKRSDPVSLPALYWFRLNHLLRQWSYRSDATKPRLQRFALDRIMSFLTHRCRDNLLRQLDRTG